MRRNVLFHILGEGGLGNAWWIGWNRSDLDLMVRSREAASRTVAASAVAPQSFETRPAGAPQDED
jgi:hypothetical protein